MELRRTDAPSRKNHRERRGMTRHTNRLDMVSVSTNYYLTITHITMASVASGSRRQPVAGDIIMDVS